MLSIENINPQERETISGLLEAAIHELENLYEGEVFCLSDLFRGYEWNRLPIHSRTQLGRFFMEYAYSKAGKQRLDIIERIRRHQSYVRK